MEIASRRAGSEYGAPTGFMAPMRVQLLEVEAAHETQNASLDYPRVAHFVVEGHAEQIGMAVLIPLPAP